MDILAQLGINTTSIFQFVLFSITMIFLSKFVFAPYAHALEEREHRTKGGEDLAIEFHKQSAQLQSEYEIKTRELNAAMKTIIDAARVDATKSYEDVVATARAGADSMIEKNRTTIANAVTSVAGDLKNETTAVAMAITNKLLGK